MDPGSSILLLKAAVGIIGAGVSLANKENLDNLSEAIFSETFGGIFADCFKGGVAAGYERLRANYASIEYQPDSLNHDLQRAARKAQLIATFFACQSCLAGLTTKGDPTKEYLNNVVQHLNDEITRNDTAVFGGSLTWEEFSSVFDTYQVAVDQARQAEMAGNFKDELLAEIEAFTKADLQCKFNYSGFRLLKEAVLKGWDELPAEAQTSGRFITLQLSDPARSGKKYDWFRLVCLIFNEEYKNNPKILAASQKQLLLDISRKLDSFGRLDGQTVKAVTDGIARIADQLKALQEGIDQANKGIDKANEGISDLQQDVKEIKSSIVKDGSGITRHDIPRAVELNYLRWLQSWLSDVDCYTPLRGGVHSKPRVEMDPLFRHWRHAEATPTEEKEFADAVPVMRRLRRAILLGDPGGGKTTTLARLAADLAAEALGDAQAPLPLFIRLGYWVSPEQALPDFIAEHLSAMVESADGDCDLGAHFVTLLSQKRAALLLDGLNEFPPDQRQKKYAEVREFISAQARQNKQLLAVASCRELDYEEAGMKFDRILITPLDPVRMRDFARGYLGPERGEDLFWKLVGEETRRYYNDFINMVGAQHETAFWRENELPADTHWSNYWEEDGRWHDWLRHRANPNSLIQLARNPLMLSMMTQVFDEHGDLPRNRGDLFRRFVNQLLDRERERELISDEEQRHLLAGLTRIARIMQMRADEAGNATTILSRAETVSTFTALYHPQADTALGERLLRLAHSASLLSLGDPVRFTHQLLQEYFAACWLDAKLRADKLPAAKLWPPDRWWRRNNWEEAAILLAGLYSNDCTPVVEWLADAQPELAAECITRSGSVLASDTREETLARLREKWLPRLNSLETDPEPQARAAIGRALGRLNLDNRKGVGVRADGLPDIDWVEIPGGEFQYGAEKEADDSGWYRPARPQRLTLPTYWISRYPVTNAQFQTFLADSAGYGDKDRWFDGFAADEDDWRITEPRFNYSNHPRETVNWYQVMAFCRWLSWRLSGCKAVPDLKRIDEWAVRLPTEFEWERAARGTKGLVYPYGNKFDPRKGNVDETGIGQTSAVGIFPDGKSPDDIYDMSGNVWEWCLSEYANPKSEPREENLETGEFRVLRGGSWYSLNVFARAAGRNYYRPALRSINLGFRVVQVRPPSL